MNDIDDWDGDSVVDNDKVCNNCGRGIDDDDDDDEGGNDGGSDFDDEVDDEGDSDGGTDDDADVDDDGNGNNNLSPVSSWNSFNICCMT